MQFDYAAAFSRNIGWITESEQQILRSKRVAIAGMGGAGGAHLLALTRLGIGGFHIADFDTFEIHNLNRQAGASMSLLDRPKVEVMAELARDINPELALRQFPHGITVENVQEFLSGVDLYVDGLDFFAFAAREMVFAVCAEMGIPAITVAPLGMSAALLTFLPGRMTLEQFFQVANQPESEKALRFLLGLAPAGLHFGYLVDPSRVDLAQHRGPSTGMACQICAGIAGTEALKILLRRGKVYAAPYGVHFDAYTNRLKVTWRPWGNRNLLQRVALAIGRRRLARMAQEPAANNARNSPSSSPIVQQILDMARWAPSGDNTQPWRFESVDENHVVVHGFDTRDYCVYDLDGHASQIAIGAMLETLQIAASTHGLRAEIQRRLESSEQKPVFDVHLTPDAMIKRNPLFAYIKTRSVQRRPFSRRPLSLHEKTALEASVGSLYTLIWIEEKQAKWQAAKLLWDSAKLRLTIKEGYEVHRSIIDWGKKFSEDKVPDQAIGLDAITLKMMHWVLESWQRVQFFNKFLAGTFIPRLQLDLLPALGCGAHFALASTQRLETIDDYIAAGRALQRFWLTATGLGLQMQPEMTPLIFGRYARSGRIFSTINEAQNHASRLNQGFDDLLGPANNQRTAFFGRLGQGKVAQSRSLRLPISKLMRQTI